MTTRDFNLNVRLSEEEYEALKFIAAHRKKSLSEIAREKLFTHPSSVRTKQISNFRGLQVKLQIAITLIQKLLSQEEPERSQTLKNLYPLLKDLQLILDLNYDWQGNSKC